MKKFVLGVAALAAMAAPAFAADMQPRPYTKAPAYTCLLYTSDAADE